jgi:arsenite-transporting ATPase
MARLALFVGKGGVGKTTVSSAYAVHQSLKHAKETTLLLSTDPAHSLGDIFQQPFSDKLSQVHLPSAAKLYVRQINAEKHFRAFLNHRRQEILSILASGSIFSQDEIEPFLDATLPGMAEMSALLAIYDALNSRRFDQIVVDTAPFGHTLRLFEMPEHFQRFLVFLELAASRDRILAAHFGGSGEQVGAKLLSDWRETVEALLVALHQDAEVFLVTTPEKFALNESLRSTASLRALSPPLEVASVVLNRAVLKAESCSACRNRSQATKQACTFLKKHFSRSKLYIGEDPGAPIVGIDGLRAFGAHVFSAKRLNWKKPAPSAAGIKLSPAQWPVLDTPLSFVLGKGGVGKTTISAALSFRTRAKTRLAVEICSVDPAPSLDDIFQADVGDQPRAVLGDSKLRASEMDSVATFKQWAARIKDLIDEAMTLNRSEVHVDLSFERRLFEQLLESVPPG